MNALPNHGNQGVEGNIKKSSQPRKLTNHGKRSLYIFVWLKSMYYESIFLIFDCKSANRSVVPFSKSNYDIHFSAFVDQTYKNLCDGMIEIHRDINIDT